MYLCESIVLAPSYDYMFLCVCVNYVYLSLCVVVYVCVKPLCIRNSVCVCVYSYLFLDANECVTVCLSPYMYVYECVVVFVWVQTTSQGFGIIIMNIFMKKLKKKQKYTNLFPEGGQYSITSDYDDEMKDRIRQYL